MDRKFPTWQFQQLTRDFRVSTASTLFPCLISIQKGIFTFQRHPHPVIRETKERVNAPRKSNIRVEIGNGAKTAFSSSTIKIDFFFILFENWLFFSTPPIRLVFQPAKTRRCNSPDAYKLPRRRFATCKTVTAVSFPFLWSPIIVSNVCAEIGRFSMFAFIVLLRPLYVQCCRSRWRVQIFFFLKGFSHYYYCSFERVFFRLLSIRNFY